VIPLRREPALPSLVAATVPSESSVWRLDDEALRLKFSRWTLIAALLLHLLPFLFWLWHWGARVPLAPPAIEVTLVRPPQAAAPKPPQEAALKPRESGPEDKTEAKKTEKPRAALPQARSPDRPDKPGTGLAAPKAAPGPRELVIRLPVKNGDATRDSAGDAYLNRVMSLIERQRIYPDASLFLGAPERTPIYSVGIDPSGAVSTITLLASSGVQRVDEAARRMITAAEPFPPLPPDYPPLRTIITIYIPVYPRRG
jgi:TonB family protein